MTVQAFGGSTDDSDLSVVGPFVQGQVELAFLVTNWNIYQSVTLTAAPDDDAAAGAARIRHRASGSGSDYNGVSSNLTVTENDDDAALTLSVSTLTVTEEGSAGYTVQLAAQPGGKCHGYGGERLRRHRRHRSERHNRCVPDIHGRQTGTRLSLFPCRPGMMMTMTTGRRRLRTARRAAITVG